VSESLSAQANKAALDQVKAEKPAQFTVGAFIDADGTFRGALTVDRKWSNGWGLTAFAYAYWNDLSVTAHPKWEAGMEAVKRF
jgi:hypothetical protein